MRNLLRLLLTVSLMMVLAAGTALAAKPVVYLQPLCTYDNSINNIQLDESTKHQIDGMIRKKLMTMSAAGDLPYEIKEMTAADHHSTNELMLSGDAIFLYPAIMVSAAIDTANDNTMEKVYTSTVIAGISLVFCMPEENLDQSKIGADGNTVSLRLLGIVPMIEAETIGIPNYDKKNDKWLNLRAEPISQIEKDQKLISLTRKLLKEDISFSNIKGNIKDDKAKLGEETYQVTNVSISSAKAQELFPGAQGDDLKFLVGYYFTSAYQKKTKRVVYPPAVGRDNLTDTMVDGAYKLSLDSANGRVDVAMSNPKHPISLDISGVANKVVPSANNVYTLIHKVWLAKSPVEGSEKAELSRFNERTVKLPPGSNTDFDDKMIYSALLMGLAQELGSQSR